MNKYKNEASASRGKLCSNDLTLNDKGNIYITDSYSSVVYKIDVQLKPTILTKNAWFKSEEGAEGN
jgi:hypothetical protein